MLQYDTVAGNVPTRVETHLAFGISEDFDPLGIEAVEARIRQHIPMGRLQIVQPLELGFAGEISCRIGHGLEAVEEIAQARFQMRLEHWAVAAERFALVGIEAGKAQTIAKAACLRPLSLLWYRVLCQNHSRRDAGTNVPAELCNRSISTVCDGARALGILRPDGNARRVHLG